MCYFEVESQGFGILLEVFDLSLVCLVESIGLHASVALVGFMPMYVYGLLAFGTHLFDPRRGRARQGYKIASLVVAIALSLLVSGFMWINAIVLSAWG